MAKTAASQTTRSRRRSVQPSSHVLWVSFSGGVFYRSQGEVKARPGSVLPRLAEEGQLINAIIPFDATLLPKTRLASTRVARHLVRLDRDYPIEIIKLTRGAANPGIYMVRMPTLPAPAQQALFCKAALALAQQLESPVDVIHLSGWEAALLPLLIELDKRRHKAYRNARTLLTLSSVGDNAIYPATVLPSLGVPPALFHPEALEFFGQVSLLKAGLLFSDGIAVVDAGPRALGGDAARRGMDGVIDSVMYKLRRWASDRSLRSHLEAYEELLTTPKARPLLPSLNDRISRGPGPSFPSRYGANFITFLVQSPERGFVFWEWAGRAAERYALALVPADGGESRLLAEGLPSVGEFWVPLEPGRAYHAELLGWDGSAYKLLMRTQVVRAPSHRIGEAATPVFVDRRTLEAQTVDHVGRWIGLARLACPGGSSDLSWTTEHGAGRIEFPSFEGAPSVSSLRAPSSR